MIKNMAMNTVIPRKIGPYLLVGLCLALIVIVLDQLSKWLVYETLLRQSGDAVGLVAWLSQTKTAADYMAEYHNFKTVTLTPFLDFTMVWNKGVSFGLFNSGESTMIVVLIGVAVLLATGLTGWLAVTRDRLVALGLSLIIGGAVGNVIDRVRFGAVADFIDVHVAGYHWPAFNIADSAIVVGALLLMIDSFLNKGEA